jgi:serine/threonine protein kinase
MNNNRTRLVFILIFVVIPLSYIGITISGADIIRLRDGRSITAEEVWHIDRTVYYIKGGQMETLSADAVKKVLPGGLSFIHLPRLVSHHFLQTPANLFNLLAWLFTGAVIFAFLKVAGGRKKNRGKKVVEDDDEAVQPAAHFPGREHLKFDFGLDIVHYFLKVFRYQISASESAPAHITSDERETSGRYYTYKLHVRHDGHWQHRRMTLGPIGENSRSKSTCYHVIYDAHMVIKIPPKPLVDFDQYMANIDAEKRIAQKIAPRQCLIPRISSILRRVYKFANESEVSDEQLDRNYLSLLQTRPDLKRFLQIAGSHVYFMDVARHHFLGPIVEDMHNTQQLVHDEILAHPDILWDPHGFYGRYGTDADPVREQMIRMHEDFQRRLSALRAPHYLPQQDLRDRGQLWLLKMISGDPLKEMAKDLPFEFRKALLQLMEEISAESSRMIQSYRNVIYDYVNGVALNRYLPRMISITYNLLDLLTWLGEKGVAVRDLKPDNLLVVGDPDKYPFFLNDAKDYTIGLIDLETAVDFQASGFIPLKQPILGGTLYYATPSHFLPNKLVEGRFGDIRRIFYLQDWYASLAIIYELVVGDYLFKTTARRLNQAMKAAKKEGDGKAGLALLLKHARTDFWHTAAGELHARLQQHSERLEKVSLHLPPDFHHWLVYELENTVKGLRLKIGRLIKAQPVGEAREKQRELSKLPVSGLQKHLRQMQNEPVSPDLSPEAHEQAVSSLKSVISCRKTEAQVTAYLEKLKASGEEFTATTIIRMMFTVVHNGMLMK